MWAKLQSCPALKQSILILSLVVISNVAAENSDQQLDLLAVSKLRFKLRNLEKKEQCRQLCLGICDLYQGKDGLAAGYDVTLTKIELDFGLLEKAVESMKGRSPALSSHLSQCLRVVKGEVEPEVGESAKGNNNLVDSIEQIMDKNDKLVKENEQCKSKTVGLTNQLEELKKQVAEMRLAKEQQAARFEENLKRESMKSGQLKNDLRAKIEQIEKLENEMQKLKAEMLQLESKNGRLQEKEREVRQKMNEYAVRLGVQSESQTYDDRRRNQEQPNQRENSNRMSIPVQIIDGPSRDPQRYQLKNADWAELVPDLYPTNYRVNSHRDPFRRMSYF